MGEKNRDLLPDQYRAPLRVRKALDVESNKGHSRVSLDCTSEGGISY